MFSYSDVVFVYVVCLILVLLTLIYFFLRVNGIFSIKAPLNGRRCITEIANQWNSCFICRQHCKIWNMGQKIIESVAERDCWYEQRTPSCDNNVYNHVLLCVQLTLHVRISYSEICTIHLVNYCRHLKDFCTWLTSVLRRYVELLKSALLILFFVFIIIRKNTISK